MEDDDEVPHLTDSSGEDISDDQVGDKEGKYSRPGIVILPIFRKCMIFH